MKYNFWNPGAVIKFVINSLPNSFNLADNFQKMTSFKHVLMAVTFWMQF